MAVTTTQRDLTAEIASRINPGNLPVTALRAEALENFQLLKLPVSKNEEYKYTPLTRELEKNFTFANTTTVREAELKSFLIPGLDSHRIVFINGVFSKSDSSPNLDTAGITVESLQEALHSKREVALKHLGNYANYKADAFAAWNTAEFKDGVFIHIADNIVVDKPIVIHHIHNALEGEVISIHRNLIVVDRNSEVTVVEKYDSIGKSNHFSNQVTEVVVDENAGFNLYNIQYDIGNRYHVGLTEIHQKRSSRVNAYTFTLSGKILRNNLSLVLDGEGIESHMYGLYLLNQDTLADNHTVVDHRKPNSFSNELYKGIMDDNSKGVFNGKIFVRPQAQKTNAFQANRNILLTDKATVNTKPQLEIWADDVKCSHGCTTGQLDEEALYYLRSRGIGKDTARAMMLYAFAGEVVDGIKNPTLREFVDHVISERLHKNF